MMNRQDLVALTKVVAKANPSNPVAYSFQDKTFDYETLNETLRNEFKEYAGTYAQYRENKNFIFSVSISSRHTYTSSPVCNCTRL